MTHKISIALFITIFLVLTSLHRAAATPTKDYSADRFDALIQIQPDGSLLVNETVTFRFVGGPFTTVFRAIPTAKTDNISVVSATMDEQSLGSIASNVSVTNTDDGQIEVTWTFDPTSDSVHTFYLSYIVQGVIQQEPDADVLDWNALPTSHDYTINASTVTVTYPERAIPLVPAQTPSSAQISSTTGQTVFQGSGIQPDQTIEIKLNFRRGTVISSAPKWQQNQDLTAMLVGISLPGAAVLFLFAIVVLLRFASKYQRPLSPEILHLSLYRQTAPPDDLSPAFTGVLISAKPKQISTHHALATLFDLANRGILRVIRQEKQGKQKGDFLLELQTIPSDLLPHEQALLDILFPTLTVYQNKKQRNLTIHFSNFLELYTTKQAIFCEALLAEMREREVFSHQRENVARQFRYANLALFLFAGISILTLFVLMFVRTVYIWPLIFFPIAALGVAFVMLFFRSHYSIVSDQWWEVAQRWRLFSSYLRDIAKGEYTLGNQKSWICLKYLPYASSFGILTQWLEHFKTKRAMEVPTWYQTSSPSKPLTFMSFAHMLEECAIVTSEGNSTSSNRGFRSSAFSSGGFSSGGGGGFSGGGFGGGAAGGGASGAH